jgi:hypothetical protein
MNVFDVGPWSFDSLSSLDWDSDRLAICIESAPQEFTHEEWGELHRGLRARLESAEPMPFVFRNPLQPQTVTGNVSLNTYDVKVHYSPYPLVRASVRMALAVIGSIDYSNPWRSTGG